MAKRSPDLRVSRERIKGKESVIKVAAIQMEPRVGDKAGNVRQQLASIAEAATQGARLMVLPELGNTGYIFNTREEVADLAEEVPGGATCAAWIKACRRHKVYLCAGITERDGGRFFNTAALIGPEGFIGKYRKIHLWDEEKLFFEPGDLGIPVFHLPFGRVGVMICYDGWHPEVARILTLQGADIICDPTCWVLVPGIVTAEPHQRIRTHGFGPRQRRLHDLRGPVRDRARLHLPGQFLYRGTRRVRGRAGLLREGRDRGGGG